MLIRSEAASMRTADRHRGCSLPAVEGTSAALYPIPGPGSGRYVTFASQPGARNIRLACWGSSRAGIPIQAPTRERGPRTPERLTSTRSRRRAGVLAVAGRLPREGGRPLDSNFILALLVVPPRRAGGRAPGPGGPGPGPAGAGRRDQRDGADGSREALLASGAALGSSMGTGAPRAAALPSSRSGGRPSPGALPDREAARPGSAATILISTSRPTFRSPTPGCRAGP